MLAAFDEPLVDDAVGRPQDARIAKRDLRRPKSSFTRGHAGLCRGQSLLCRLIVALSDCSGLEELRALLGVPLRRGKIRLGGRETRLRAATRRFLVAGLEP